MDNVKISVIVPVYNVENYLRQCLDSIINQTLEEVEIICVNDGSTDKSPQILEEYAQKDERIKIINKENKGLGAARNTGIDHAIGEYIGFVDSDDWIDITMYEKLYKNAKSQNSDIVMCPVHVFDESANEIKHNYPYFTLECFDEHFDNCNFNHNKTKDFLFSICVTAWNKIYKTEFLKETNSKFPEGLIFEDNPFFFKTYLKANRVSLIRDFLYFYRINRLDSILSKFDGRFSDLIKIHKLNIDIFNETNKLNDYKIQLLNYIISNVINRYNQINEIDRQKFYELIKQFFEDMDLENDEIDELDSIARTHYQNAMCSESYKELELLEKKDQLLAEINRISIERDKFSSHFLYEQRKCENIKHELNDLKTEYNKMKKVHDYQVNSLKREVNAYKSRKIVKFADKIWEFYYKPKFLSKKVVYVTINILYQKLKPFPKVTDLIHKTNNKFNLLNKEAARKYALHQGKINESINHYKTKKIEDIKVAIICDEFTYDCFKYEFNAIVVEPSNWLRVFEIEKPDLFFCESAWSGVDSKIRPWKGKIYSSINFKNENRTILLSILEYCKKQKIPTIFWNKEDPTHYEDKICNFVDTALKFDYIFTTAEECVEKYKEDYGHERVYCLPFAGQPKLFNPIEKYNRTDDVVFAGSWYNQHPQRCIEMEEIFDNILDSGYNLKIYNRHYGTKDPNHFFPKKYQQLINPSVSFDQIEKVYKESKYSLNINTETQSKTMFARRVFELMLCNTLVLSNYSVGMENLCGDNVIFVDKGKFNLLDSEEKRINGLYDVLKYHTYSQRFKQILDAINYDYLPTDNGITLYYVVDNQSEIEDILKHYESINYKNKKLTLLLSKNIPNHLVKNIYQQYANNEVSVYSLYYLINQNGILSNNTPYFVFADLQLKPDLIEKGILHYSYIEKQYGIALGDGFTFKKVKNIKNVILHNENFINVFNSIFKDISIEIPIYTIQTSISKKHEININYESTKEFTDQVKI